ncbi:MAG: helix-turn-helix transcriptional regulator [Oscillospiraceae bacterium]
MLNLKLLRQKSGFSQLQLGALTGTKPSDVARWESGVCLPPLEKIIKLCLALSVDVGALFPVVQCEQQPFEHSLPVFFLSSPQQVEFECLYVSAHTAGGCFAIKIETDLLAPRINPGDLGLFCLEEHFACGDVVLVLRENEKPDIALYCEEFEGNAVAKMCEFRAKL